MQEKSKNLELVIQNIQEKPWEFSWHQLLFIFELINKNKVNNEAMKCDVSRIESLNFGCGKRADEEPAILKAYCNFSVPSSDCVEYKLKNDKHCITLNQTSLIGINGVLPQPYTEKILQKLKEKNSEALDFLNIFHHRFFGLSHKVEKKLQFNLNLDPFENFGYCHAISGLHTTKESKKNSEDEWREFFPPVANLLWQKTKNSHGLITILNSIFPYKFQVEEFLEQWIEIADESRAYLNHENLKDKILGKKAKCLHTKIRLIATIANIEDFENTLPGSKKFKLIEKICKYYALPGLVIEYKIELEESLKNQITLRKSKKLGHNTWLKKDRQNANIYFQN